MCRDGCTLPPELGFQSQSDQLEATTPIVFVPLHCEILISISEIGHAREKEREIDRRPNRHQLISKPVSVFF